MNKITIAAFCCFAAFIVYVCIQAYNFEQDNKRLYKEWFEAEKVRIEKTRRVMPRAD